MSPTAGGLWSLNFNHVILSGMKYSDRDLGEDEQTSSLRVMHTNVTSG